MAATTTRRSRTARPKLAAVPDLPSETPKPKPAPAKPKSQPKPKPEPLGMSGYRAKYGITDEQIVKEIRDHFQANPSQGSVADWDDAKILAAIGWSLKLDGALKKLRPLLAADKGTQDS